jgi:hypothetical protein
MTMTTPINNASKPNDTAEQPAANGSDTSRMSLDERRAAEEAASEAHVARTQEAAHGVGYGRPPKSGQFKKGHSANPKGRPTGRRNLRTGILEVYQRPTNFRDVDNRKRTVPALVALHQVHMNLGLQGNVKSAAIVFQYAAKHNLYAQLDPQLNRNELGYTKDQMAQLSDETIAKMLEANEKADAELAAKKLPPPT